jgi:hypothetical protein
MISLAGFCTIGAFLVDVVQTQVLGGLLWRSAKGHGGFASTSWKQEASLFFCFARGTKWGGLNNAFLNHECTAKPKTGWEWEEYDKRPDKRSPAKEKKTQMNMLRYKIGGRLAKNPKEDGNSKHCA